MNNFKPKVSSESRALQTYSRYSRRQQQDSEPKGKKALGKDIGKLMEIFNMPLDVFFEVTSHLKPVDILQLARTSKELRRMLLSRSARSIWIAARKNVIPRMPDCPEHMNEAQYAHLIFERVCGACGVNQSVNVDYAIPGRFCGPCWKTNARNGGKLARKAGLAKKPEVFNLLPKAHIVAYQYKIDPITVVDQESRNAYYEPEFVAIAKQYKELIKGGDQKALQQFVDERKADTIRRFNFNLAIGEWEKALSEEQSKEKEGVQQERVAAIEGNLRELGYEPSEYPGPAVDYGFYSMLHQPRKLTPRIWNTIRPRLVEILDMLREERAEKAFKVKWQKRRDQLAQHYRAFLAKDRDQDKRKLTLPGWEDMLVLCTDVLTGAEPDADVTPDECAAIEKLVLANADEYLAKAKRDLAALARKVIEAEKAMIRGLQRPAQAKGSKGKGKGKQMASSSESEEDFDEEADLALLEATTAMFSCTSKILANHPNCRGKQPYLGMIQHWQECHGQFLWSAEPLHSYPPNFYSQKRVDRFVEMLSLPKDATMSAMVKAIEDGRRFCSCGFHPAEKFLGEAEYLALYRLLAHFNMDDSASHQIGLEPVSKDGPQGKAQE
ncbi:hypothetical protein VTO73DRAFT_14303 [Trametes versicolor]